MYIAILPIYVESGFSVYFNYKFVAIFIGLMNVDQQQNANMLLLEAAAAATAAGTLRDLLGSFFFLKIDVVFPYFRNVLLRAECINDEQIK